MRKVILYLLIFALGMLFSTFFSKSWECNSSMQCFTVGNMEGLEQVVHEFTELDLSGGNLDVTVTCGESPTLKIQAPSEILKQVHHSSEGGTLVIKREELKGPGARLEVLLTTPKLEKVEVRGSSNLVLNNVDSESLHLVSHGSSRVDVVGVVDRLKLRSFGSSVIYAKFLQATKADIKTRGSVQAELTATQRLEAEVSGSGEVIYYGSPKETYTMVSGSGSIIRG